MYSKSKNGSKVHKIDKCKRLSWMSLWQLHIILLRKDKLLFLWTKKGEDPYSEYNK